MANGWAPDGAVQDQIDDTVKDAVLRARVMMPAVEGGDECGRIFPPRAAPLFRAPGPALPVSRSEMSLCVLAYNMKRMIHIMGIQSLIAAIRT
jgi:hypothetical protein